MPCRAASRSVMPCFYSKQNHPTRKKCREDHFYATAGPCTRGTEPAAAGSSYHGRIRTPFRSRPLNNSSSASARSAIFAAPSGAFAHE